WVSDGTTTQEMGAVTNPSYLTALNGKLLFVGQNPQSGQVTLWTSDGTTAGTVPLTGISGANAQGLNPSYLFTFNGEVFFEGRDAVGRQGLWVSDGTAAGTHEL